MTPRIIALTLVALLAILAPAGAQEPPAVGIGTANSTLDLAEVAVSGLPVDSLNLGGLLSYASTVHDPALNTLGGGKPFALSSVRLPVGGELVARSDGDTGRPGQALDIGPASLTVGELLATVNEIEARSTVSALTGTVDAGLAGLQVGAVGVTSVVSATNAAATNGAVLEDLSLDLTDILPLDLLQQLPLDLVLRLVDGLEIDLDLTGRLVTTLRDVRILVEELEAIDTVHNTIDSAQTQLTAAGTQLAASTAELDALKATLSTQAALLDSACQVALPEGLDLGDTSLDDILGGVGGNLTDIVGDPDKVVTVPDLGGLLSGGGGGGGLLGGGGGTGLLSHDPCHSVQETSDLVLDTEATIAALNSLIDKVQTTIDEAVSLLDDLLDQLLELLETIDVSQVTALLRSLVDGLAGTQLLGIERLSVGVTSVADAQGSSASAVCDLHGLEVLGQTLGNTCADLEGALGEVTELIEGLLSELPISASVVGAAVGLPLDAVSASAPKLHSTPDNQRDGDYFVSAAGVEPLRLDVASFQLTQVADSLLADLLGEVDALVAELSGATGLTIDLGALDAALEPVLAAVGALPTGDLLDGVQTPGLGLGGPGVTTGSRFSAAGSGLVPIGTPGTPGAIPTPGTGQTPTPGTNLPTTGGGVAGALLLMVGGGAATVWLRRR